MSSVLWQAHQTPRRSPLHPRAFSLALPTTSAPDYFHHFPRTILLLDSLTLLRTLVNVFWLCSIPKECRVLPGAFYKPGNSHLMSSSPLFCIEPSKRPSYTVTLLVLKEGTIFTIPFWKLSQATASFLLSFSLDS